MTNPSLWHHSKQGLQGLMRRKNQDIRFNEILQSMDRELHFHKLYALFEMVKYVNSLEGETAEVGVLVGNSAKIIEHILIATLATDLQQIFQHQRVNHQ